MMASNLYRVTRKHTGSRQPGGTYWTREVVYCGYDREEALRVYHAVEPTDYGGGYGNAAKETIFESLDTSEIEDDETGKMEECEIE